MAASTVTSAVCSARFFVPRLERPKPHRGSESHRRESAPHQGKRRATREMNWFRGVRMQQNEPRGDRSSDGGNSPESLFMQELRKRGISIREDAEGGEKTSVEGMSAAAGGATAGDASRGSEGSSESRSSVKSPPRWASEKAPTASQLEKSRSLNSEGLEGLPARAWELIKLGGTFPLAFLPLALSTVGIFVAIYLYFGQLFIHSGQANRGNPPYVEPFQLLEEELAESMGPSRVPFNKANPNLYE